MHWSESEAYQQFIGDYPEVQEGKCRQEFEHYLDNMWEPPAEYTQIVQAYLEFSTSDKLQFPKLVGLRTSSGTQSKKKRRRRPRRRKRR